MTKPSNPPAFPSIISGHNTCPGASLRDYFAGQALVGLKTDPNLKYITGLNWYENISANCYEMADAMLAEREKGS